MSTFSPDVWVPGLTKTQSVQPQLQSHDKHEHHHNHHHHNHHHNSKHSSSHGNINGNGNSDTASIASSNSDNMDKDNTTQPEDIKHLNNETLHINSRKSSSSNLNEHPDLNRSRQNSLHKLLSKVSLNDEVPDATKEQIQIANSAAGKPLYIPPKRNVLYRIFHPGSDNAHESIIGKSRRSYASGSEASSASESEGYDSEENIKEQDISTQYTSNRRKKKSSPRKRTLSLLPSSEQGQAANSILYSSPSNPGNKTKKKHGIFAGSDYEGTDATDDTTSDAEYSSVSTSIKANSSSGRKVSEKHTADTHGHHHHHHHHHNHHHNHNHNHHNCASPTGNIKSTASTAQNQVNKVSSLSTIPLPSVVSTRENQSKGLMKDRQSHYSSMSSIFSDILHLRSSVSKSENNLKSPTEGTFFKVSDSETEAKQSKSSITTQGKSNVLKGIFNGMSKSMSQSSTAYSSNDSNISGSETESMASGIGKNKSEKLRKASIASSSAQQSGKTTVHEINKQNTINVASLTGNHSIKKYGKTDEILGRGASGIVRLAVPVGIDNKRYAIKEFRKKNRDESSKEYVKKVIAEFCISSALHHENVVQTVDLIQDERKNWCVVMEYCSGGDLYSKIHSGCMKNVAEINCYWKQLIHGISYLHSMGVAHRDIKPENLILDDSGRILKITDFGVSEVFRTPFCKASRKVKGLCGSGPYIAPEEFEHDEYDPAKIDIWSAGIVYYVIAYNSIPWKCANMNDSRFRHFLDHKGRFWPIDRFQVGPRQMLYKILEKDPAKRISMSNILKDSWVQSIKCCTSKNSSEDVGHVHTSFKSI